jgi:outer membrane protein OmpA-like peptidoglycan-associated protein
MRGLICAAIVSASLALVSGVKASQPDPDVVKFHNNFYETLKSDKASRRALAELVSKDRAAAEKCLEALGKKLDLADSRAEARRMVFDNLEISLILSAKAPDCSERMIGRLAPLIDNPSTRDFLSVQDPIFVVEQIIRLCPEKGASYTPVLAKLYLREGQSGKAKDAAEKAMGLKGLKEDPGLQDVLRVAQRRVAELKKSRRITKDRVLKLFDEPPMGVEPETREKLEVRNSLQTTRILFDPWKFDIKEEYRADLDQVGEALKEGFARGGSRSILIEGHSDEQGPRERNMTVSQQRAEAIKDYLVGNFELDESRITTEGFGPDKPFSSNRDPEGYRLNRRVEFKMIDDQ